MLCDNQRKAHNDTDDERPHSDEERVMISHSRITKVFSEISPVKNSVISYDDIR